MDSLLKRVEAIALATRNQNITEEEEIDEFIDLKRKLNIQIRKIRNDIKDRNEYANLPGGCPNKNELSQKVTNIKNEIKLAQDQLKSMRELVKIDEKQMKKKGQDTSILINRLKMCDLIDAHIKECENWSKGLTVSSVKEDPSKQFLLKGAKFNDEMPLSSLDEELQPTDPTQTELENIDDIEEWKLKIN